MHDRIPDQISHCPFKYHGVDAMVGSVVGS